MKKKKEKSNRKKALPILSEQYLNSPVIKLIKEALSPRKAQLVNKVPHAIERTPDDMEKGMECNDLKDFKQQLLKRRREIRQKEIEYIMKERYAIAEKCKDDPVASLQMDYDNAERMAVLATLYELGKKTNIHLQTMARDKHEIEAWGKKIRNLILEEATKLKKKKFNTYKLLRIAGDFAEEIEQKKPSNELATAIKIISKNVDLGIDICTDSLYEYKIGKRQIYNIIKQ